MSDRAGFFDALIGDGRPVLKLLALGLIAAGLFVVFQAATGAFLPQDTEFLGMTAKDLCARKGCRIVHFMIHDRVSFGGVLLAIGVIYLWLAEFPLRQGQAWAWWAFALSGASGFMSFLAYLGYGYLDTWHAAGTLALLPIFVAGLFWTRSLRAERSTVRLPDLRSRAGVGRTLVLLSTFGLIAAGGTIATVGMTSVFVPQDLSFTGTTREELHAINARLIPLIAHDRAGFGGALVSVGLAMFLSVLYSRPARSLQQALALAGLCGFSTAIGIHPIIGYTDMTHLGPAILGAVVFLVGMILMSHSWRLPDLPRATQNQRPPSAANQPSAEIDGTTSPGVEEVHPTRPGLQRSRNSSGTSGSRR